jgi:hypothetical protein
LALLGQDVVIFISSNMAAGVRADEFQFSFLLLSSSSVFQLGFSSGRTFFKSPNLHKALFVNGNFI